MSHRTPPQPEPPGDPRPKLTACPDAEDLTAFAEGRLDDAFGAAIERHVALECSACRRAVAALLANAEPPRALPARLDRRAWFVAAAAVVAATAGTLWWRTSAGSRFEQRLVAAADSLATAEPGLFRDFRPYSAEERARPATIHRGETQTVLHHPRGRVRSDRPAVRFTVPPSADTVHLRVTSVETSELLGERTLSPEERSVGAIDWPFAPLPRGRGIVVQLANDDPLEPESDQQVIVVATAEESDAFAAAWAAIEQHAPRDLVSALRTDYALRHHFLFEAEAAVTEWLRSAPDLPEARTTAALVRRGGS